MALWTDLATWRGPTVNRVAGGMTEWRGLVIHIAEGTYEGTISWQLNPASEVSSHFVVRAAGHLAQVVDTRDTAWTQQAGNGHWLSVECEGHTPGALTTAQCEAIARLLVKCHQVYGVPLQIATSPAGRGLGHHSMGTAAEGWTGATWGHDSCPGPAIKAQKAAIVARAIAIISPIPAIPKGADMPGLFQVTGITTLYLSDGFKRKTLTETMWEQAKATWGNMRIAKVANLAELDAIAGPDWTEAGPPVAITVAQLDEVSAAAKEGAAEGIDGTILHKS